MCVHVHAHMHECVTCVCMYAFVCMCACVTYGMGLRHQEDHACLSSSHLCGLVGSELRGGLVGTNSCMMARRARP